MPRQYLQDPQAEQAALRDALRSPEEGGAAVGVPAGTDVPAMLDADPATRNLLQEQIYMRAYGTGQPNFGTPQGQAPAQTQQTPTDLAVQPQEIMPQQQVEQGLMDRINALFPEVEQLSEDELAAREMARIQDQIDAINQMFDVRMGEERRRGEGRMGQSRAVGALSGTLYDPFGQARMRETEAANVEAERAIEAERRNLIASLTSEAAKRAQGRFSENRQLAMQRADALVNSITDVYRLNMQEQQALRQEALQRAQMTGELDGEPTLNYQQFLLDTTQALEQSRRADEQLELQRMQFERSGWQTQMMPDGSLVAIDYTTQPPSTQVIGRYARPVAARGGGASAQDTSLTDRALRAYMEGTGQIPTNATQMRAIPGIFRDALQTRSMNQTVDPTLFNPFTGVQTGGSGNRTSAFGEISL